MRVTVDDRYTDNVYRVAHYFTMCKMLSTELSNGVAASVRCAPTQGYTISTYLLSDKFLCARVARTRDHSERGGYQSVRGRVGFCGSGINLRAAKRNALSAKAPVNAVVCSSVASSGQVVRCYRQ